LLLVAWPLLVWRGARERPERIRWTLGVGLGLVGWAGVTYAAAASGWLAQSGSVRPPPFMAIPVALVAGTVILARSRAGAVLAEATPLWILVGLQSFRLPLELVMHHAAERGLMPPQMSFGVIHGVFGLNYDIVTGGTALLLGLALRARALPRGLVLGWNVLGLVLLFVIVTVSVASTPVFALFGREPARLSTWILFAPYVWLPAILVGSALLGHLLLFRRLATR
jgi:hypothetical protein